MQHVLPQQRTFLSTTPFFTRWRLACLFTLLLSAIFYLPALSGLPISDDGVLLNGSGIGGGDSLLHCFTRPFLAEYYRPLVSASFYLEHKVAHFIPFFYHQTNILMHVLTTGILIALLRLTFPRHRRIALMGGLIFAVQPVQISAVAWIGGRTDSQCALFMVAFAYALIRGVQSANRVRLRWILLSAFAFACALLTKEQMLPTVLLVPLAFRCFDTEAPAERRRWSLWTTGLFVLIAAVFLAMWLTWGSLSVQDVSRGFVAQMAYGSRTTVYYTLLLLLPTSRWMHSFSLDAIASAGIWSVLCGFIILGLMAVSFRRWLRTEPAAAWFLAFTFLSLFLIANFIPIPTLLIAPYRAGVTGLGVAALMGWAFGNLSLHVETRPERVKTVIGMTVLTSWLLWGALLTFLGSLQLQDAERVYTSISYYNPYSPWVRGNLTVILLNKGKFAQAIQEGESLMTQIFGSSAWRTQATALRALHDDPRVLERAGSDQGSLHNTRRWIVRGYDRLGSTLLHTQDIARAKTMFTIGAAINPEDVGIQMGLASCAFHVGDYATAENKARLAIALSPDAMMPHMLLGDLYAQKGQWVAASREYASVVKEETLAGTPYLSLAKAQWNAGNHAGAEATLQAADKTPVRLIAAQILTDIRAGRKPRFDVL